MSKKLLVHDSESRSVETTKMSGLEHIKMEYEDINTEDEQSDDNLVHNQDIQNTSEMDIDIEDEPIDNPVHNQGAQIIPVMDLISKNETLESNSSNNEFDSPYTPAKSHSCYKVEKIEEDAEKIKNDIVQSDTIVNTNDIVSTHHPREYLGKILDLLKEENILTENKPQNNSPEEMAQWAFDSEDDESIINLDHVRRKLYRQETINKGAVKLISNKRSYQKYLNKEESQNEASCSLSNISLLKCRNTKDKDGRDILFACFYCLKLVTNVRIHYFRRHTKEKEVQQIQRYSFRSPERRKLLCRLRNMGNFKHNVAVLKQNEGIMIVNRRRKQSLQQNCVDYIPCNYCLGFFFKQDLNRHAKFCALNFGRTTNNASLDGTILVYEVASALPPQDVLILNILHSMKESYLFPILSKDFLILRYANFLIDGKVMEKEISERLKNLGVLLILLAEHRESEIEDISLRDYLTPSYYQSLVYSAVKMCNIVGCKKAGSLIRKLGHSIRCCCNIKIGIAIKENCDKAQKETEDFLTLFHNEWKENFSSCTFKTRIKSESLPFEDNESDATEEIPLAEELVKLSKYLINSIQERKESLETNISLENWLELCQAVLCRIVIFNKTKEEETTGMLLASYSSTSNLSLNQDDDIYRVFSVVEKLICNRLDLARIDGRNGKYVAIILPRETKDSLNLLMQTREEAGIPKQNMYVFSNGTNNDHFRSWNIINKYGKQCQLKRLHLLNNPNHRKFISTYTQFLLLNNNEMDQLVAQLNLDASCAVYNPSESYHKGAMLCNSLINMELSSCHSLQTPKDDVDAQYDCQNSNNTNDVENYYTSEDDLQDESPQNEQHLQYENFSNSVSDTITSEEMTQYIESEDDDDLLNLPLMRRKVCCEKTDEGISSISSERNESTKVESDNSFGKITIAVSRNTKNKRCHDKLFACFYCSKLFSNMRIHYFRRHPEEAEVQEILSYSIRSSERSNLLCRLRNLGNFKHNIQIIKKGEGMFIVNRRPNQKSNRQNYLDYIPCRHCYGFFFKYDLKRHANCCVFNLNDFTKHILSEGSILLYEATSELPTDNILEILSGMPKDEVFDVLGKDYLIMKFGNFLTDIVKVSISEISLKMEYLAKLIILLRKQSVTQDASLSDFLVSSSFDAIISSVLKLASSFGLQKSNSLIYVLGHSIRCCCHIKIGLAIKESNSKKHKETEEFLNLFNTEWKQRVGSISMHVTVKKEFQEKILNNEYKINEEKATIKRTNRFENFPATDVVISAMELSLTKDLIKLSKCLIRSICEKRKKLEENICLENWLELAQVVLCRILVFNKRREGEEISRMLVSSYRCKSNWSVNSNDDSYQSLTAVEQLLSKRFDIIRINGKNGKTTSVILPTEAKFSLDLLMETRDECGIPSKNIFLFSNSTKGGRYQCRNSINKYGKQCSLKKLHLLANAKLRNFIAICTHILALNNDEMNILSKYFIRDVNAKKNLTSTPKSAVKVAKLSKLLLETEASSHEALSEFCALQNKESNLDAINYNEEMDPSNLLEETYCIPAVSIECESNNESEEIFPAESVNRFLEQSLRSSIGGMNALSSSYGGEENGRPLKRRKVLSKKAQDYLALPSSSVYENPFIDETLENSELQSDNLNAANLTSKITISVSRNTKDKRCYDKLFSCFYCSRLIPNVRTHYFRCHSKEKEIQDIQQYSIRSLERNHLLSRLRNLGNFKHNVQVIRSNEGMLIVTRRPNEKSDRQNYKDYLPCRHCYGFFHKYELKHHGKTCFFNSSGLSKHTLSEGIILLYEATSDLPSENIFSILASMKDEEIFNVLSNDYLIIKFGNFMADNDKMLSSEIGQKMRDLTNLLILLREKHEDKNASLSDFLVSTFFDQIIKAVLKMSSRSECKDPNSFTVELGHSIRSCCNIKIGIAIKENDCKKKNETDEFLTLFNNDWKHRVGSFVLGGNQIKVEITEDQLATSADDLEIPVGENNFTNTKETALTEDVITAMEIPLTEDLITLSEYIVNYIKEKHEALKRDFCLSNWLELTQAALCRIVILNKKRGDDTTRMLVSTFSCKSNWSSDSDEELYKGLTALEKMICKKFDVLKVKGKRGKYMPIIIPPEAKCSLDLLMESREACGIPKENVFMFSNASSNGHYRSWNVVNKYGKHCRLKMLHLLTNPGLRKFISIRAQLLALSREDMDALISLLDQDASVPNLLSHESQEFMKICKLLITSESNSLRKLNILCKTQNSEEKKEDVSQNFEMSSTEEMDWLGSLEPYDYIPSISEEYDKDYIELNSIKNKNNKQLNRFIWPSDLKRDLLKNFRAHITDQKCPGKQECEDWLASVNVTNIPWKKVKDCVKNAYYVRK